jgi:hypothetical protein
MGRVWDFLEACPPTEELHQALLAELAHNPDAEWQQQKAQDVAQALQKGVRGTWLELFTDRDRQVFRQIADPALLAWGYQATLNSSPDPARSVAVTFKPAVATNTTSVLPFWRHAGCGRLDGYLAVDLRAALSHRLVAVIVANLTALHLEVAIPAAGRAAAVAGSQFRTPDGLPALQAPSGAAARRCRSVNSFAFTPGCARSGCWKNRLPAVGPGAPIGVSTSAGIPGRIIAKAGCRRSGVGWC